MQVRAQCPIWPHLAHREFVIRRLFCHILGRAVLNLLNCPRGGGCPVLCGALVSASLGPFCPLAEGGLFLKKPRFKALLCRYFLT